MFTNMKKIVIPLAIFCWQATLAQQKDYPIRNLNFTKVQLTDQFWLPRIRTNHLLTIPASFERCENTGRVKNFEMAAAKSGKFCTVYPFDDTDIYKTIEGASYSMTLYPDPKMDHYIDSLISIIGAAQEPDGYLYTARTIDPTHPHSWSGDKRWIKERDNSHELYNSGHLYEAAAAHYYATGKRNLLNIALKNADLVCSVFGPGKLAVAPGHEVVEMGLVKLYRITGKAEYLNTAKFFIDQRGHYDGYDKNSKDPWKSGSYWQDHQPVIDQREAVGHAVRAGYLYAAVADIAALTGDSAYLRTVDSIWENVVQKKIYVQGSVGAVGQGERYGDNYELPNATAYNETCAAIANIYWNARMFQLHGDAKYIDLLEKTLYNGFLSGIGLDGKSFFYTNAMEIKHGHPHADQEPERSGWFTCSCCPTNVVRLLPSIPGYAYAQKADRVYVNLFFNSTAHLEVNKQPLTIEQKTDYPWNGNLQFILQPQRPMEFPLYLRIPGWANNQAIPSDLYAFRGAAQGSPQLRVNGVATAYTMDQGYAVIKRKWKKGDQIELVLPMEVRRVTANAALPEDQGKVALQRGPLMYCAEWTDNNGLAGNILVPDTTSFTTAYQPQLLNGITVIKATVPVVEWSADGLSVQTVNRPFTAIPYYAWANRGKGEMVVWLPEQIKGIDILNHPQDK